MGNSQPAYPEEPQCSCCGLYDEYGYTQELDVEIGSWGTGEPVRHVALCSACVAAEMQAVLSHCSEFGRWQWVERLRATRAAAEKERAETPG